MPAREEAEVGEGKSILERLREHIPESMQQAAGELVEDLRGDRQIERDFHDRAAAELQRQAAIKEKLKQAKRVKREQVMFGEKRKRGQVDVREKASVLAGGGTVRERLRNKGELRRAFVLKEVLEKPVGLK